MNKPHRIAAGGLIFRDNAIVLVKYRLGGGKSYLVAPGGALEEGENIVEAIVRETKEETNLIVQPLNVVAIEDLICQRFKMSKTWMTCEFIGGQISKTDEAIKEGIVEVGWFTRAQLAAETVYPELLKEHDWSDIGSDGWKVVVLPSREADI